MLFQVNALMTGLTHPYISIHNPPISVQQIVQRCVEKSQAGKDAGATYTYVNGQHGSGLRVDITTGQYTDLVETLKGYLNYLDAEGKPRKLVVYYGKSQNAQETAESITTYLEGTYSQDREKREISFYPKDGNDTMYVMELVKQYPDRMCLKGKQINIDPITAQNHGATGLFADIEKFTGVPYVTINGMGGLRFLCLDQLDYSAVADALSAYKIAYTVWKD